MDDLDFRLIFYPKLLNNKYQQQNIWRWCRKENVIPQEKLENNKKYSWNPPDSKVNVSVQYFF